MSPQILVPVVTPLLPDGQPDFNSLESLLDHVRRAGADGALVAGSSGESVALRSGDRHAVVERAITYAGGRMHIMIGLPTLGTADVSADARAMAELGADSLLVAAPAGLALSPVELEGHFSAVAEAGVPVIAYEVPSRVGTSLPVDLILKLGRAGVLAGVKDSSGNLTRGRVLAEAAQEIAEFRCFTGSEETVDAALLGGFDGAIPGLANVFPDFHVRLAQHVGAGRWAEAARVQGAVVELLALYAAPLPDASPVARFFAAVKEALVQLGVIAHNTTSRPLSQADDAVRAHVADVLARGVDLRVAA